MNPLRPVAFLALVTALLQPCPCAAASSELLSGAGGGLAASVPNDGGWHLVVAEPSLFDLILGGLVQADYRRYGEQVRGDDRFDVRRARLSLAGALQRRYRFRFEYEFQGNEARNLVDGYVEWAACPGWNLRVGQTKVPFGIDSQTADRDQLLAERSLSSSLGPGRDVGILVHGILFGDGLVYGLGLFNGDGTDGSTRGSESNAPEVGARLALAPLRWTGVRWLRDLTAGVSATDADVDLANVALEVKSTGMVGTSRSVYVLNANSKFGVLQDAGRRRRLALEAAWVCGPVAVQGEAMGLRYTDLDPSGGPPQDADFRAWHVDAVVVLTGEEVRLRGGALQPLAPKRNFTPGGRGWGAAVLAARVEGFRGDEDWILPDASVSAASAAGYSVSLTWVLNPSIRLLADYSRTRLSDPIKVRVMPDGSVDTIDEERVVTGRVQLSF